MILDLFTLPVNEIKAETLRINSKVFVLPKGHTMRLYYIKERAHS